MWDVRHSKESKIKYYGMFRGLSERSAHHCNVHVYPPDQDIIVSLKYLTWRMMKPRSVYLIQRYLDIVLSSLPHHA